MNKRKKLGQHFLKSNSIAKSIASAAKITKNDLVLEIGTGHGILIPFLCKKASRVYSIESDKSLYLLARSNYSNYTNLILEHGNGFHSKHRFSIFVSSLPYSKSRIFIEWLLQKKFLRAVVLVQKEFAEKLISQNDHRAVSVLANYGLKIEVLMNIKKSNFSPPPKVDSVLLLLTPKRVLLKSLISTVNLIFSYKRKTLQNILKQFNINSTSKKRLGDLTGDEIIKIAKKIIRN